MNELIMFSSPTCGPCKMMKPMVAAIANSTEDLAVTMIDVTQNPSEATAFNVRSVPTFIFLKNNKEVSRLTGATPKGKLQAEIDKLKV